MPPDPIPMRYAIEELNNGVKETGANPRILEYFRSVGMSETSDRQESWCAAFMYWCFKKANLEGIKSARARDWASLGADANPPMRGDVVVFARGGGDDKGHVGFVVDLSADKVKVLAGNQGNAVSEAWLPKDGTTANGTRYKVIAFRKFRNTP